MSAARKSSGLSAWWRDYCVEVCLFFLVWVSSAYFYHSPQHNENARWDQMRAILEQRTLAIEKFAYNTADVVELERHGERHVYPNKAPGTTMLGLGPFWLFKTALRPVLDAELVSEARYWHLVAYLTRVFTVGLLSALAAVLVYRLLRKLTDDAFSSALAVVAVFLGSIAFPYATLFYSHQQAAAQLAIAFVLVVGCQQGRMRPMKSCFRWLAAGSLLGFSVATEYPTAILTTLIGFYAVVTLFRAHGFSWRRKTGLLSMFVLGGGLGGLTLVVYNLRAFGRVFFTPYQIYAAKPPPMFESHSLGFMGVHWPGWRSFLDVLAETTVRPQRGLVYLGFDDGWLYACSPVLWLALPGLVTMAWRGRLRLESGLFAAMIAAYLTFNSCYGDSIVFWGGATSVGPRHVIPMLPFLAFPIAFVVRRLWMLFVPLLLLSIFAMLIATATEPRAQYEWWQPWSQFYLPAYLESRLAIGVDGLFHPGEFAFGKANSFNLGWWLGLTPAWQLAPLMLAWLILGGTLLRCARQSQRQSKTVVSSNAAWCANREVANSAGSDVALSASLIDDDVPGSMSQSTRSPEPDADDGLSRVASTRSSWRDVILVAGFTSLIAAAPSWYQRSTRPSDAHHGLIGRYFRTENWKGPARQRLDPTLDFDWKARPLYPVPYSVEWTGYLRVPVSGDYRFTLESDDGSTVEIDGRLVVDNGGRHGRVRRDGMIRLDEGDHPIRIRYFNSQFDAEFRLCWTVPGKPEETIPTEALLPKV